VLSADVKAKFALIPGMLGCRKWLFGFLIFGAGATLYLLQGSQTEIRPLETIYPGEALISLLINGNFFPKALTFFNQIPCVFLETDSPDSQTQKVVTETVIRNVSRSQVVGKYLIDTEGCKIPDMPVRSSMISKFTKDVQPTPEVSI